MFFYLYKITNLLNGCYYLGKRQCKVSPEQDTKYFGSGLRIKAAIKKYGKQNFSKEIISVCDSIEKINLLEKTLITQEVINDVKCYNIALGGHGGYTDYSTRIVRHTTESKAKISKANKGRKRPDVTERLTGNTIWLGKKRTAEDKAKKSVAAKRRLEYNKTEFNKTIVCPVCFKEGQQANMMRWHFDKCKANFRCDVA